MIFKVHANGHDLYSVDTEEKAKSLARRVSKANPNATIAIFEVDYGVSKKRMEYQRGELTYIYRD